MSDTFKNLGQAFAPAAAAAIFTVASSTQAIVREIRVVNTDAAPQTVTLYNNGTTGASTIQGAATLQPGETLSVPCFITMQAGDTIAALGSAASKLAVNIYGMLIT